VRNIFTIFYIKLFRNYSTIFFGKGSFSRNVRFRTLIFKTIILKFLTIFIILVFGTIIMLNLIVAIIITDIDWLHQMSQVS